MNTEDNEGGWRPVTHAQAVEYLDEQIEHAADQVHDVLCREGLDEHQYDRAMQKAYRVLDEMRTHGLSQIDQAFARIATRH